MGPSGLSKDLVHESVGLSCARTVHDENFGSTGMAHNDKD